MSNKRAIPSGTDSKVLSIQHDRKNLIDSLDARISAEFEKFMTKVINLSSAVPECYDSKIATTIIINKLKLYMKNGVDKNLWNTDQGSGEDQVAWKQWCKFKMEDALHHVADYCFGYKTSQDHRSDISQHCMWEDMVCSMSSLFEGILAVMDKEVPWSSDFNRKKKKEKHHKKNAAPVNEDA